jgi:hypothetical protein
MLSIERTKTLIDDPSFSDKEIEEIRDSLRALAEIAFEKWQKERILAMSNKQVKSFKD